MARNWTEQPGEEVFALVSGGSDGLAGRRETFGSGKLFPKAGTYPSEHDKKQ